LQHVKPETQHELVFRALSTAFLTALSWDTNGLCDAGIKTFEHASAWLKPLVKSVLKRWPERSSAAAQDLHQHVREFPGLREALFEKPLIIRRWPTPPETAALAPFPVRPLRDVSELAALLALSQEELEWFADVKGTQEQSSRLSHYQVSWVRKKRGGVRLLEAPKMRLREIQRTILREVLNPVPLHDAAHGFCRGRSVHTHAAVHAGQRVVVRFDLANFFLSVSLARIAAIFRALGYVPSVAYVLARLCTHRTRERCPRTLLDASVTELQACHHAEALARTPHLPQGAPTSPALANLSAYTLDCRLHAFARSIGAQYSRYADDLTFSGDFRNLSGTVRTIVHEQGFVLNHRKTSVRTRSMQQRVTGLVVNVKPQVPRRDFDAVKALLWKCAHHGVAVQNPHPDFHAHLRGLVAWAGSGSLTRQKKLDALFERIVW
jgi:RNA-directed DNA polymerase